MLNQLFFENFSLLSYSVYAIIFSLIILAILCAGFIVVGSSYKKNSFKDSAGLLIGVFLVASSIVYTPNIIKSFLSPKESQIDEKYSLVVSEQREIKILKNESKESIGEIISPLENGLTVVKKGKVESFEKVEVSSIRCGDLDYDECVTKIKESLPKIVASRVNNTIQVVQF